MYIDINRCDKLHEQLVINSISLNLNLTFVS